MAAAVAGEEGDFASGERAEDVGVGRSAERSVESNFMNVGQPFME